MVEAAPGARSQPLSPHLQIWRWHVTMAASIAHRASGVALYGGALILAGWALALASGGGPYLRYMDILASVPGRIVLFGITVSIFFHLANGIRHLVWDFGRGFEPKTADLTAWIAFVASVAAAVVTWTLPLALRSY